MYIEKYFEHIFLIDPYRFLNLTAVKREELDPYPTTVGILLRGSFQVITEKLYPKVAEINPRSKILTIVNELDFERSQNILEIGYKNFKLFDNSILNIRKISDDQKIVTISSFNPFLDTFKIFHQNLCENNTKNMLVDFKSKMASRLKNLHEFPLKVTTAYMMS